jgi:hypothetical protein
MIEIKQRQEKKTALPSTLFSAVLDAEERAAIGASGEGRGGVGQRQDSDRQDI